MLEEETRLLKYFFDLLARRDYSEQELRNKAKLKEYSPSLIDRLILELKEKNFLNEQRLAENLVENYSTLKGKKWLQQKLQSRLVKREIVEKILSQYQESIPESLKRKVEQKYKIDKWTDLDIQTKQKILGFLARQGFGSPYEILRQWQTDESN